MLEIILQKIDTLFFDIAASAIFTAVNVVMVYKTNFENLIYYDVKFYATICLMVLAISFMLNFMWYMSESEEKIYLPHRIVIPHPTFICALALTICVTVGYCYILAYKIALFGCDKAVEAQEYEQMALDSVLRLSVAVYALVSLVYIIQRSYVGSMQDSLDRITRNTINFVFGVIWFRFLLLKALFLIEQFCRDHIDMNCVIKNFCPPYIKNGFTCNTAQLRKEQHIWYRLHYGLLKSAIVTCASELIPVLLVAHWIACGRAKKFAQHGSKQAVINRNTVISKIKRLFSFKIPNILAHQLSSRLSSLCTQRLMKRLSILLSVLSIVLWLLGFHNYINDDEGNLAVFTQDGIEVFTSFIQLCLFVILFCFTRTIPKKDLNPARYAESRADHVLLLGSTIILTTECMCEVIEIIFFSPQKQLRFRFIVKLVDIFYSVFSELANWFEVFCLRKIGALNDGTIMKHRHSLPFVAGCGIVLNMSVFVMTYFYIENEKHNLQEVIRSLPSNYIIFVGIIGRILDTANYVYTFTSALCWLDVLMRYKKRSFFVLGKKFLDENNDDSNNSFERRMSF